jgi:DNA-binding PadR family transcriptional regulator
MPETPLTTLEFTLLGLLALQPRSGYDVHRLFAGTPLVRFSASPGSIYPALKRLAGRGLVADALDRPTEARPRRIYSITAWGRETLEAWLRQPVSREELVRQPEAILLRFSLAEVCLTPPEVIAYLEGFRRAAVAYVEELTRYRDEMAGPRRLYQRLALEHGIQAYESQIRWSEGAIVAIRDAHSIREA